MSLSDVDDYATVLRLFSMATMTLGTGSHGLAAFLLMRPPKSERTAFVLLLQISSVVMAIQCLAGFMVLDATEWGGPIAIVMSYGPFYFLGPRAVQLIDWVSMLGNTYTAPFVLEMFFFRTLIVFNVKYNRITMLLVTKICFLYGLLINYPPLIGYVDVEDLQPFMNETLKNLAKNRVCFGLYYGTFGDMLWTIDGYARGVVFLICVVLWVLMFYKLRILTENMSTLTRKVHTAFLTILTIDAVVVFVYFAGTASGLFNYLTSGSTIFSMIISTFSYPFFTVGGAVQGVALLFHVPYLKSALLGFLKRRKRSRAVSVMPSITHQRFS